MKLIQHPEYHKVYFHNQEAFQHYQAAVALWKEQNITLPVPVYSLQWTFASAQSFTCSLAQLFHEYNRILWDDFNYYRQCGGQCCVSGEHEAPTMWYRMRNLISTLLRSSSPT